MFQVTEFQGVITNGITISEWLILGSFQATLPISVLMDIGIEKCSIYSSNDDFVEKITNFSSQTRNFHRTEIVTKLNQDERASNSTNTPDSELYFSMRTDEKAQFKAVIFYHSNTTANIKMTFVSPSGSTIRWGPSSGLIVDTSDTVVFQVAKTNSGSSVVMGTPDTAIRCIELVGEVTTNGTAGNVEFSFAQNNSDAFATAVTAQSYITVNRM